MRSALVVQFGIVAIFVHLSLSGDTFADDNTKSALEADSSGWTDLMPAEDLAGWKRVALAPDTELNPKNAWSVKDGLLICDGVGVKEMLLFDKEFDDGVFHVEWRVPPVAGQSEYNSGIYVRSSADGKLWHQAQIAMQEKPPLVGDLFGDTLVGGKTERVVIRAAGENRARPQGEWNIHEVTAKGSAISVWVNGATTCEWKECPLDKGRVGLQAEFFLIEFRNLKFKPLGK